MMVIQKTKPDFCAKLPMQELSKAATAGAQESPIGDEELVAAVAAGDRRAYAILVERHLDRTVAVAKRVVGSQAEAEDIAQEAFLRLWNYAHRFRPESARFTTWFYRITVNLCLDARRRPSLDAIDAIAEPADPSPLASESLEKKHLINAVAAAITDLPQRLRMAITLTYEAGLSNAEAAASLNISVKALETLLVRARKTLRTNLAAWRETPSEPMTGEKR